MAKHEKLLEKFTRIPSKKDLTFSELETLLSHYGFEMIEGSGSRVKFVHADAQQVLSIHKPHPGNILKEYVVKQIQELLKGLKHGNA